MEENVEKIYIKLMDEDVATARPAAATRLSEQHYKILLPDDYDPEDEEWEFLPGDIVRCELTDWGRGLWLNLAVEKIG